MSSLVGRARLNRIYVGALVCVVACETREVSAPDDAVIPDVVTYQYDVSRAGITPSETFLTPKSVTQVGFGKVASFAVDGYVYAQPLYVSKLVVGGAPHEMLFVATQHDSVYAFDATGARTEPLWHVSLLEPGENPVPAADTLTTDIVPEIGITGTPVIERTKELLYVVSKAKRADGTYVQRFHALHLADGSEAPGAPLDIVPQIPGTGGDQVGGVISFNPLRENQRSALALIDGRVWIAWAAHGDKPPYHGWMVGYDTADLTKPPLKWMTTPDGGAGGIWMGASGPSTDGQGNIYVSSGNGDVVNGGEIKQDGTRTNFSLSALRLRVDGDAVKVIDWFTPHGTAALNAGDLDFGTIGGIVMPDQPGPMPHRLITAQKAGIIYVLNRDDLGGYEDDSDRVIQRLDIGNKFFIANPVLFDDTLYVCPHKSTVRAYPLDPTTGLFALEPTSSATCIGCFQRGSTPAISANGVNDAILWVIDNSDYAAPLPGMPKAPAILHAYDARDLTRELYTSPSDIADPDAAAPPVKFTVPVIANGRVYVGGQGAVSLYSIRER